MNYKIMKLYNVAIVGASGLVGRKMLQVLEERNFPINNLKLLASERSAGRTMKYRGNDLLIEKLEANSFNNVDIALFSAGSNISKEYSKYAVQSKCIVIDNSSAWRMTDGIPLIVPEVNSHQLKEHNYIIANPNCSTIQLVVALHPIHKKYGIKRLVCSTYQSISGAGQKGVDKLMTEISGNEYDSNIKYAYNTAFHSFADNDFTEEENKMINEIHKIMEDTQIGIAVTCVRVPTLGGHSESVNLELEHEYSLEDVRELLANSDNIVLMDKPQENIYPYPQLSNDKDFVFVGRLRRDNSVENGLYLWVVADNLRKGAATNAVQIAEKLIELELV